jgi:threonine/homoserine/homoserine lactone efflux protein
VTALVGFVFLGLFSPGPNVILLTTSGARFGFRATLPHLLGVALGVGFIAFVTGLGLGALIEAFPTLRIVLMIIASFWILSMAWKLWHAKPVQTRDTDRPFTFIQAILFQWVNPKIWAVATSASAMIAGLSPMTQATTLEGRVYNTPLPLPHLAIGDKDRIAQKRGQSFAHAVRLGEIIWSPLQYQFHQIRLIAQI